MNVGKTTKVSLRRELRLFDVTNLVVGAIIGADIYVAAALGSSPGLCFSLPELQCAFSPLKKGEYMMCTRNSLAGKRFMEGPTGKHRAFWLILCTISSA